MSMHFDFITLMPECFDALKTGVLGQGIANQHLTYMCHNPRDFTESKHGCVDDRPYGGGPGMVLQYQPLKATLDQISRKPNSKVIYLGPDGQTFNHQLALEALHIDQLIFVCGRYEGIDQRFIDHHVDATWSLGDFVLSGGEFAALSMVDAIARHIPGVLGHTDSACQDSFYADLLDYPHYTRPEAIDGHAVPNILLSGDHKAIAQWRMQESLGKTWQMRPDLLKRHTLNDVQQKLLKEYIRKNS